MKKFDTMIAKCEEEDISTAEMADRVAKAYKAMKREMEILKDQQARIKELAVDVLDYAGEEELETNYGRIVWVPPTTTVRYDTKGIDSVCLVNADFGALALPFRIDGKRRGYVKVTK